MQEKKNCTTFASEIINRKKIKRMKNYFIKFFLSQIWFVVAAYVFFGEYLAVFFIEFDLVVDLVCLVAYLIRKRKGENIEASIMGVFDFMPDKWLGIGAFIGAFVMMHWEENSQLCVFLCVTAIIGYIFDIIKKYNTWKKEHRKINS